MPSSSSSVRKKIYLVNLAIVRYINSKFERFTAWGAVACFTGHVHVTIKTRGKEVDSKKILEGGITSHLCTCHHFSWKLTDVTQAHILLA